MNANQPLEYISSSMSSIPPPQYASSTGFITPSSYGCGSIYGISPEVDAWISGASPESYLYSCAKITEFTNTANFYRSKLAAQAMTRTALQLILCSRKHGWTDNEYLRKLGLRLLPGAICYDFVKSPYHLVRMAIALAQSGRECRKVEGEVEDGILESLWISLEVVFKILIRLGLATPQGLKRQENSTRFYDFFALARLLEAYGSRFAPPSTVYLASQKILPREHCSGLARLHFDQIHGLKDDLIFLPGASLELEQLLPCALQALAGSFVDRDENHLLNCILQRLCRIRDELPGLVLSASR